MPTGYAARMLTGGGLDALGITSAPHRMPGRGRWLSWCWGSFAVSVVVVAAVVAAGLSTGDLFIEPLAQLGVFALLPGIRRMRLAVLLADDRYRTVAAPAITTAVLRAAGPSGVREVTVRVGQVGGFSRCSPIPHRDAASPPAALTRVGEGPALGDEGVDRLGGLVQALAVRTTDDDVRQTAALQL